MTLAWYRILRAFRIFKVAQGLQNLIKTLARSLKEVTNLGILLALLFFVTSVMVVEAFGRVCVSDFDPSPVPGKLDRCNLVSPDLLLDPHATFVNAGIAVLSLFRICTGDNWSTLMTSTGLEAGPRSYPNSTAMALQYLLKYNETFDPILLDMARRALPLCQTRDELGALSAIISCNDQDYLGYCPSTCGNRTLSAFIFTFFMCASQYVLLNLVSSLPCIPFCSILVTYDPA